MKHITIIVTLLFCVIFVGCGESQCRRSHCPQPVPNPPVIISSGPVQESVAAVHLPVVYCQRCGVLAGESTKCPGYSSHSFTTASAGSHVVCQLCGVHPTLEPTNCPGYSSHSFILCKPDKILVCQRCGLCPTGKPTKCPGYSSHSFAAFKSE